MTALRPQAARWFELLVASEDAFIALEALAAAGCVEVEAHGAAEAVPGDPEFTQLARRFSRYWPAATLRLGEDRRAPAVVLASARAALQQWAAAAEPVVGELQQHEAELSQLQLADAALQELADSTIDFSLLATAQEGVQAALFALPSAALTQLPARTDLLLRTAALPGGPDETLVLVVASAAAIEAVAQAVAEANGRRARLPVQLQPTAAESRRVIAARRDALVDRTGTLRAQLDALAAEHRLAVTLGDIARTLWCQAHAGTIELREADRGDAAARPMLARITGWTTDGARVEQAIEASSARALLALPPPQAWPKGAHPPLTLANPWWARPFEVFPRLVGMPAASGADPSALLAVAVPLMFGFMFGDVGQGLVVLAVGLALRKRWPMLAILIPAGLSATLFGLAFGSVFCLENLVHPLWLHPLHHPLPVLVVPVAAGAVLLLLGLALGLLQAWWQQRTAHWLRDQGPVVLAYLGLGLAFFYSAGWLLVLAAALASMLGASWWTQKNALHARSASAWVAAIKSLGELVEHTLQLAINTLSFARVGAFALAHAGLASAVVALAQAAPNPLVWLLVLLLGNLLIIGVEGLVVSIQTTRLVLFEFFARFFEPAGREFRPLSPPPTHFGAAMVSATAPVPFSSSVSSSSSSSALSKEPS